MPRLLADENIHPRLVEALCSAGADVERAVDHKLTGAPDEAVLDHAIRDGRILFTADKDFGAILEAGRLAGRGRVLLLRYRILDWTSIARDLLGVLAATAADFELDSRLLVVVEEGQYRVRRYNPPEGT